MNKNWVSALSDLSAKGEAFVVVTLLATRGSTPRDSGTKMVVSADQTFDTIGGGHLEYKVIANARQMLAADDVQQAIEHYPLGPSLGQCCGGSTSVLFERFAASSVNIMLFGAGHVGKALISILAQLPCRVRWVDARQTQFGETSLAQLGAGKVSTIASEFPADEVAAMPGNSYYLVMTHNHQMDFEICEAVLKRGDFHYLGLIGSATKWKRFQLRLQHKQYVQETIEKIRCPVGLSDVPGKHPMEVAVSIAAEIINIYHRDLPKANTRKNLHWKNLQQLINEDN